MIANNPGIDYYLLDPGGTLWARRYDNGETDILATGLEEDRDFYKDNIPLDYNHFKGMRGPKNENDLMPDPLLNDRPSWHPPQIRPPIDLFRSENNFKKLDNKDY